MSRFYQFKSGVDCSIKAAIILAASAAVFCTQPHVILLKYGEILGKTHFGFPADLCIFKCLKTLN